MIENVSLSDSLKWCVKNGVVIKVAVEDGVLAVTAGLRNISSIYEIEEPVTTDSVGAAMLNAILAVEHGTRMFDKYGAFPPIPESNRGAETRNREDGNPAGANNNAAPPELPVPTEVRWPGMGSNVRNG
jgi:hypothetical protein